MPRFHDVGRPISPSPARSDLELDRGLGAGQRRRRWDRERRRRGRRRRGVRPGRHAPVGQQRCIDVGRRRAAVGLGARVRLRALLRPGAGAARKRDDQRNKDDDTHASELRMSRREGRADRAHACGDAPRDSVILPNCCRTCRPYHPTRERRGHLVGAAALAHERNGDVMMDQFFDNFRKASESSLQMQQEILKQWTQPWPRGALPARRRGRAGRNVQNRWLALGVDLLNKHRHRSIRPTPRASSSSNSPSARRTPSRPKTTGT